MSTRRPLSSSCLHVKTVLAAKAQVGIVLSSPTENWNSKSRHCLCYPEPLPSLVAGEIYNGYGLGIAMGWEEGFDTIALDSASAPQRTAELHKGTTKPRLWMEERLLRVEQHTDVGEGTQRGTGRRTTEGQMMHKPSIATPAGRQAYEIHQPINLC